MISGQDLERWEQDALNWQNMICATRMKELPDYVEKLSDIILVLIQNLRDQKNSREYDDYSPETKKMLGIEEPKQFPDQSQLIKVKYLAGYLEGLCLGNPHIFPKVLDKAILLLRELEPKE